MRNQFYKSVEDILDSNHNTAVLLGDVGVYGFRNCFEKYPQRVFNIGVLEQSMVGIAAGLAKTNIIPFVHSFNSFIAEKCLEQLKVDFGYPKINGNFIGMGAPYDYPQNGPTHECPGDVMALNSIPNMQIIFPGNSKEFDVLIKSTYNNGYPTYFRVNTKMHTQDIPVKFAKANVIKKGKDAVILCYGVILNDVIDAAKDLDVTILYYSTVKPFDYITLLQNFNENIISIEPFYSGSLNYEITKNLNLRKYTINNIGIPHEYIHRYDKREEIDKYLELDKDNLEKRIKQILWRH